MPEPILTYDISTNPFPLQASASNVSVTIVATNNSAASVSLAGFTINLPVGTGGGHLTNAAASIVAVVPYGFVPAEKTIGEGTVRFTYESSAAEIMIRAKESVIFVFNSIAVNPVTGTAEITIGEVHTTGGSRTKKLNVTKFPQGWGAVTFEVTNPVIAFDGEAAMTWKGPAGATYTIEYYSYAQERIIRIPAINEPALANEGRYPSTGGSLKLHKKTMFTLTVELEIDGVSYRAQNQKTIDVGASPLPVIRSFTASKYIIGGLVPETVKFKWDVQHAATLELDGNNVIRNEVTGKTEVDIVMNRSGEYKLTAKAEDLRSVPATVQIQTYGDFLNFNRFTISESHSSTSRDYDKIESYSTLEEGFTFYTNQKGQYNYLVVNYVVPPRGPLREVSRKGDVLDFKWEIVNGEVLIDLNPGMHSKAERISVEVRGTDLYYKTAPNRPFTRKQFMLKKQRVQSANAAPEFTLLHESGVEPHGE
jgi:hypothetical protein